MTEKIDEQVLLDLGFKPYEETFAEEAWVAENVVYALHRGGWQIWLWSGLGDGPSYGFKVQSPSEPQLRLVVQALTEENYDPQTIRSSHWAEVGSGNLSLEELKTMRDELVEEIQRRDG
jgi:hypothetical protein